LEKRPEFQIIGEASDGLEAIQKAEELQPDLILLDIGLPKLNGIEAAKRIRIVAPHTKILFVSQESDFGLVDEAMRIGAWGYVHKQRARTELLPALEVVLGSTRFVSGCGMPSKVRHGSFQHDVQFYSDDGYFSKSLADLVHSALKRGETALVVATEKHRSSLIRGLADFAIDLANAQEDRRLILLDAAEMLSRILVHGMPDSTQFSEIIGPLVSTANADARSDGSSVTVFGEMVALLWAEGNYKATIRLEQLWNELALQRRFSLRCAYPADALHNAENGGPIMNVCHLHSMVCSI
jgi:CheY-like chemotaxis protein